MARRIKASRWPSVLAEVLLLPLALLASTAHAAGSADAALPNNPLPSAGADDATLAGANGQDVYLDVTLNGSARGIVHFGDRGGQLWASDSSLRALGVICRRAARTRSGCRASPACRCSTTRSS